MCYGQKNERKSLILYIGNRLHYMFNLHFVITDLNNSINY